MNPNPTSSGALLSSHDLFCHCGDSAVIAVHMTNIANPRWIPQCERCYRHHLDCSNEVNDHEMRHFGGAYGLVTWDERRDLEGATQDAETGYLDWQNAESIHPEPEP